jgi:hypothetical protein
MPLTTQDRRRAKIFLEKSHPLCYVERMAGEQVRKEFPRSKKRAVSARTTAKSFVVPALAGFAQRNFRLKAGLRTTLQTSCRIGEMHRSPLLSHGEGSRSEKKNVLFSKFGPQKAGNNSAQKTA